MCDPLPELAANILVDQINKSINIKRFSHKQHIFYLLIKYFVVQICFARRFFLYTDLKQNYRYMVDMVHVDADDPVTSW